VLLLRDNLMWRNKNMVKGIINECINTEDTYTDLQLIPDLRDGGMKRAVYRQILIDHEDELMFGIILFLDLESHEPFNHRRKEFGTIDSLGHVNEMGCTTLFSPMK
jgi:hypothetical protein